MQIKDWLANTVTTLDNAGVDAARTDCLVLLEDIIQKERSWLIAHDDTELTPAQISQLDSYVQRRVHREPLAYIRGKAWFYGRLLTVNSDTLIPRPETEAFISFLKLLGPKKIIDIGTGSGAIAITASLELPRATVIATDTSTSALAVAQHNAALHDVTNIHFLHGSLLEPLSDTNLDDAVIVANLPYVPATPSAQKASPEITHEPAAALFSGEDGLKHYRAFWREIAARSRKPTHILTEALQTQHNELTELATQAGYTLEHTDLLVQHFARTSS